MLRIQRERHTHAFSRLEDSLGELLIWKGICKPYWVKSRKIICFAPG